MIRPSPHIADLDAYALANSNVPSGQRAVLLNQNESIRPPSPAVGQAAAAACQSALYPDPECSALRAGLAAHHRIDRARILCGAGSLDLIAALARAYAGPGRAVLVPAYAYPFFATAAKLANARVDFAPESNLCVSVDGLLAAVQRDTAMVFVANPGNPTGTHISASELRRLRHGLRDGILLIIDEAYGEFASEAGAFELAEREDVVVLRTFSKAYGMAGFRVGWGYFPHAVALEMRKVLNPGNLPTASQATALAALQDDTYMRETVAETEAVREWACTALSTAGVPVVPSATNFLLIPFQDAAKAARINKRLTDSGIFLRPQRAAGLGHALRMTIGPRAEVEIAVATLTRLEERDREDHS